MSKESESVAQGFFTPGLYRLHLTSKTDNDWLTIYAPLREDGTVAVGYHDQPLPHLFQGTWNGDLFYGEVVRLSGSDPKTVCLHWPKMVYLPWPTDREDLSLTNLGTCPMILGQVVLVWPGPEEVNKPYPFVVRAVQKL